MTTLKKATSLADLGPGQWFKDEDGNVVVRCGHAEHSDKQPRFGHIHGRGDGKDWKIAPDGTVTPSVFFRDKACGWHEFVRLEGWEAAP